ncbi:hypothetical protein B0H66DRAFT_40482 [Apodospora peruviana]|uniref:Uncharacterized protein n=1 Tax=Apodospora peruviana TaxID=516989 RepID=A0AAE0MEV7_9PEZI|nr:hypothetical protein B0H66DRAFT_40482 [Apodospora peruviana]
MEAGLPAGFLVWSAVRSASLLSHTRSLPNLPYTHSEPTSWFFQAVCEKATTLRYTSASQEVHSHRIPSAHSLCSACFAVCGEHFDLQSAHP